MASSLNEDLRDLGVSHTIGLRRLSTALVAKVIELLNSRDKDIVGQIKGYDEGSGTRRLETMLRLIRKVNTGVYQDVGSLLKSELVEIAKYESGYQSKLVGGALKIGLSALGLPTAGELASAIVNTPFVGRLLDEWIEGLAAGRFNRLRDTIRFSVVEGESTADTVRRVQGTKAMNYRDGVLAVSRRAAEALTRTSVLHTATVARQLGYEANGDILEGWRFVATLEPNTCPVCMALDGNVYPLGGGPVPPRHPNCRCTTVPSVKGGGKAERITYAKWLKSQPPEVQDAALGPTRAKLFRDGKLPLSRFADDKRTFTLAELEKEEAAHWKEAFWKGGRYAAPPEMVSEDEKERQRIAALPKAGEARVHKPGFDLRDYFTYHYPNLRGNEFRVSENRDQNRYNCAADAVGDNRYWWWPAGGGDRWPSKAQKGDTITSFDVMLTKLVDGEVAEDADPEEGHIKLALFAKNRGTNKNPRWVPTHLMRQLPDGRWQSKHGNGPTTVVEDPYWLSGGEYGKLVKLYDLPQEEWAKLRGLGK